jgi:hypothetical protein
LKQPDKQKRTSSSLIRPDAGQAARLLGAAVTEERVVLAAFLVAEVWPAVRADVRVAKDYLEVAGLVSREDSLADSRVLVGYWAAAVVVVSLLVAYFRAVSKHSDSDAQAYSARPPGTAERSDDWRSDLVCLPTGVRPLHPAR